jgi:hypothetical protein
MEGDIEFLLRHESMTLLAASEILRANLSVLEYLQSCGQLPNLASQPLDDVILSSRRAFECANCAAHSLDRVAADVATLVAVRNNQLLNK